MSLFDIIYTILIGPLQLIFEVIYAVANRFIGHPGLAIIVLSLIMNFLVLPLYRRADAMQEEARDMDLKLSKGVKHIKKSFSGDERMMILQAYYRQNNYKPTDALNGSVSLLLEIPFFMAAYQFLSHLNILNGVSLGPITDLGAQDGLIHIGGLDINLLPILMTAINVISSTIYLKGFPVKTKIQLYAMSAFFLVFLYTSPSGLVFYWTLNNVFSLVKTIFYKLKNPRKVLGVLFSVVGVVAAVFGLFVYDNPSIRRKIFIVGLGVLLQLPMILYVLRDKIKRDTDKKEPSHDKKFFLVGALLLTALVGLLIPSALLAASPQEFVDIMSFYNPLWYVVNALCLSAGTFLVWLRVFYWLASPGGKAVFDRIIWIMCCVMVINYLFFGTKLGIISATLQFESGLVFDRKELLINTAVVIAVAVIMYFVASKWKKTLKSIVTILVIALIGMSAMNISKIQKSVAQAEKQMEATRDAVPHFALSKEGKNVVVIMLDRGMGQYVPYMINEKPELKEKFDGFTYYPNVISHGGFTNFGIPGLFGGYEYTPVEMNKREDEALVDKHNEALKVMPVLFDENGYDVTVCDPTYANYQWVPDTSVFDEYPDINTYVTEGYFSSTTNKVSEQKNLRRNFFCYSLMKTMPVMAQDIIYNNGQYNYADASTDFEYSAHVIEGTTISDGINSMFMEPYKVLTNLPTMTNIDEGDTNTFMMICNNTTHEPMLLQAPNYEPSEHVDNTAYEAENADRFTIDGVTLKMDCTDHMTHYHINMAALLQIGNWLDYLKDNDVYDNTRIIIVSDHGRPLSQIDELILNPDGGIMGDAEFFYPLLMVKDFDSEGFEISDEFMTNADVPTIAVEGIIDNPTNPFTGMEINNSEKTAHEQYIIMSDKYEVTENNGNVFIPATWYGVQGNMWDKNNWNYIDEVTTRPDEVK